MRRRRSLVGEPNIKEPSTHTSRVFFLFEVSRQNLPSVLRACALRAAVATRRGSVRSSHTKCMAPA